MASKQPFKTTFEPEKVIRPIFTGGSVALDNGAKILATPLGEDVILTNPSNGKHLAKIEGDGEQISTLTLTPSGSHLITCSRSLSMKIYALKTTEDGTIEAKLTRSLKPHGTPVVVLAVDRTSTLLATGGTDGAIKVWDIVGGYVTHTFRGPSVLVSALHFFEVAARSNDLEVEKVGKKGKKSKQVEEQDDNSTTTNWRLVSGSQDGKVRVWDLYKRAAVANLDSHVSNVQGLDYSPEQNAIVSAGRDKTIIWWDARSWKIRKIVPCLELIEAVGFVDGGRLTYSAGAKGCLRIWDTDTGRELTKEQPAKAEAEGIVSAVSHPELPFVLCVQVDHTLALYKVPEKDDVEGSLLEPFRRISGTHDSIIDLTYLLPDRSLLALATNAEDIRIVSVKDSDANATTEDSTYFGQDLALLKGHDDIIVSLDIDWSGYWVATGAKDNTARLWRIDPENNSFTCYATFTGHTESIGAVALPKQPPQESSAQFKDPLSHPPPFLLTGSQDQTVKKWDIPREAQQGKKGGRAVFTRKAHDKDINAMDVHPSGQLFASSSQDKMVKIWSVAEGEVQGILRGHRRGVWSIKFAPAQCPAIQGDEGQVAGKGVVLTGSADKTVKLWSLTNYTCIRTFEGHSNSVLKVVWLNMPKLEGKGKKQLQFASAGSDGLVKVWDANSGEAEATLDNHEDRIWALAVNSSDNTIVSGDGDSIVTFWKDTTAESQAAATEAAQKLVEQEQELENHIHAGSYRDAIVLALQLNHPGRLLSLFTSVVNSATPDQGSLCGLKAVDKVLATLSDEQIFTLLLRLRDWNTNARTAAVAQRILWALVRSYPASKFSNLSVKGARGQKSLKEVLNALKVYTERHYRRMDELVDESYLVEYTLREMDSLAPAIEDVAMDDAMDVERDAIMAS
ncbi:putative U3 small nucleolar RNA-associated protein 13 [Colletotrichum gloeosporioides]|uniref:Putative U3 small nucleolar RNA-associated protein 13 n=1 Tax=Colletotrichum gloeosporioides TaxID=474922 RepID=A0A8H4FJK9_COLGL|nr:putative U3 small nucleolar RNA-associated protein 13 [Colletotrichum gloeosporioides]KAF3804470.1 putative U3 small nucleolar RNA-associated protein 13 [Colletotrichum gloeosporioides]